MTMAEASGYSRIIEGIFMARYTPGAQEVPFQRSDIVQMAKELGIDLPKNLGDVVYSFRYRKVLPEAVRVKAPKGKLWVIRQVGRSRYCFSAVQMAKIAPSRTLAETKVPDATPGLIAMYALGDEQALLAKLRYNRLLDVFTGVACYSLQSHLRTAVAGVGQVETDEIYVGLNRAGVHFVFPVQAKGKRDSISVVQVQQDIALCKAKFPHLICCPIAAQFMADSKMALFALEETLKGVRVVRERHYLLVPPDRLSKEELEAYRQREADGAQDP